MTDIKKSLFGDVPVRFVDLGDGTFAMVVSSVGGAGVASATAANQLTEIARLEAVRDRLPATQLNGRLAVEPLGTPGQARQVPTTTTSANTVLTASVGRISLFARVAPLRYNVGSTAQTANAATSHYLSVGERIDIDVPTTPNIAVIRASDATVDGAAEITELS